MSNKLFEIDLPEEVKEQIICAKRLRMALRKTRQFNGDLNGIPARVEELSPSVETHKAIIQLSLDVTNVIPLTLYTGSISDKMDFFCDDSLNIRALQSQENGKDPQVRLGHEIVDPTEITQSVVLMVNTILDQNDIPAIKF
jgi:hypothetical protein